MNRSELLALQKFATQVRIETVKEIGKRGFGHLGGSLSIVDVLAVLYEKEMNYKADDPKWADRDVLVCSKGHAGPAIYATLALKGFFPMEQLQTLNQPGTHLPSHCDRNLTIGIDMTTGSLGQGTSAAVGMALAQKMDRKDSRTYLFVGDGECDEGQVWESFLFANQHKLDNLICFIDDNGKQLDGFTKDVMDLGDIEAKVKSFGWHAVTIDGHDIEAIYDAIEACKQVKGVPSCIVLKTVKGKGVKDLEEMLLNHHITIDDAFVEKAVSGLNEQLENIEKELNECSK